MRLVIARSMKVLCSAGGQCRRVFKFIDLQEVLAHSLVFSTKEFLGQPSNNWLPQSSFIYVANRYFK